MSATDSLDRLVADLLTAPYAAEAVGSPERRAAAERDERYRARYAALTGRQLPTPREIRVALGFAQVAAEYRRRYGGAATPDPDEIPGG